MSKDNAGSTPNTEASDTEIHCPLTSATIDLQRYTFSEGKEIPQTMAAKLEAVLKIPMKTGGRIVTLVEIFRDFP